jgi:beta-lactam-binding protein with PASTA domain
MAKLFEIKPPEGVTSLELDSQRRGTIHYTVKNVSAREIDGRAAVVAVPPSAVDPNHPVQKGWVKLDGPADKHFGVGKDDTYTVNVAIPPKAEPGTYSFRLDVNWVAKPDEGDSSQAIKFEIKPVQVKEVKWGLIALFAVLFLAVLGGLGYFLTKHTSGNSVPNLVGMTVPQATALLIPAKLNLNQNISTVVGKPEDSDHIVSQDPAAGSPVPADLSVKVTVGAELVTVPLLIGHTVADAQQLLKPHLSIGNTTSQANPNFAGGIVFQQTPAPNTQVQSDSTIAVVVTPATVPVPNLVGLTLNQVSAPLTQAGLSTGSISGDQLAAAVISTDPPPSTTVPVGSKVNLRVPSNTNCVVWRTCVYVGNAARYMVTPSAALFGAEQKSQHY